MSHDFLSNVNFEVTYDMYVTRVKF